ncbi:MAG: DUF6108 family protein [Paludibacter sp.]|nr:DUF6108 family protein [Paludibacter sp.]
MKICLVLMLLVGFAGIRSIEAQSDLEIKKVFDQYGNQKGVVMVELTGEMLEGYEFSLFKSMTIRDNPEAGDLIRSSLVKDEIGAKKVKQVVANGVPTSIFLQLPPKGKFHRLILFNENSNPKHVITLIYIESKSDSEDVLKLILKKK